MRWAAIWLIFVVTVGAVYGLPKIAEVELFRHSHSAWSDVVVGDLLGCALIFLTGFRKTAVAVYVLATGAEGGLLFLRVLQPRTIVWMTDLAPTLVLSAIVLFLLSLDRFPVNDT